MSSEKIYQSVPYAEEEVESLAGSLNTESTENLETTRTPAWRRMRLGDEHPCKEKARRMLRYWPWAAHAVLLTTSVTLFALSFCMRYGNHQDDDTMYTKKYSSYCKNRVVAFRRASSRLTVCSSCGANCQVPHRKIQPDAHHGLVTVRRRWIRNRQSMGPHHEQQ